MCRSYTRVCAPFVVQSHHLVALFTEIAMSYLTIIILHTTAEEYSIEMRFRQSGRQIEVQLVYGAKLRILWSDLLTASTSPVEYGHRLTAMFFTEPAVRLAWAKARSEARGTGGSLHIRLMLDVYNVDIHNIVWETLCDLESPVNQPLSLLENIIFTRVPFGDNLVQVLTREYTPIQTLVAIANPLDINRYNLPAVDLDIIEILNNCKAATDQVIALARNQTSNAVTVQQITEHLREKANVLCLICHGILVKGEFYLCLEGEDGNVRWISGNAFVKRITNLSRQPLLIFLASCYSGSPQYCDPSVSSLGAQLVLAGVGAVIAIQERVSYRTIARLLPLFLVELHRDGNVPRALAAARGSIGEYDDWIAPILYSQLSDGFLWEIAQPYTIPASLPSPYRSLHAYTEADEPYFFGRDALIKEGLSCWQASNNLFLAVIGASGSGKSSLAQAGILPKILQRMAQRDTKAQVIKMRPGKHPLQSLGEAMSAVGLSIPDDFEHRISKDPSRFTSILQPSTSSLAGNVQQDDLKTILFIDQFEEIFSLCKDESSRDIFDATIHNAIVDGKGFIGIVITLRSDFYHHTAQLLLRSYISSYQLLVRQLFPDEMKAAIKEPVRQSDFGERLEFEPGLVETMIEETGSNAGALPLLAFTLSRLWEARNLNFITYQTLGGVRGSLNQQAEQFYHSLSPKEQDIVRYLLLQLVQFGEGGEDSKRRVNVTEVVPADYSVIQILDLIRKLSDARLLTTTADLVSYESAIQAQSFVEISHEALIRSWTRLRSWLEVDREAGKIHRELSQATKHWKEGGHEVVDLWLGSRLTTFLEYRDQLQARLTRDEQSFIDASQHARRLKVQAQIRQSLMKSAVMVSLVVVTLISYFAYQLTQANRKLNTAQGQIQQLQIETLSQRIAADSLRVASEDPDISLLLSVEAWRIAPTNEAIQALRNRLQQDYLPDYILYHNQRVHDLSWGTSGSLLTYGPDDNTVRIWNISSGKLLTSLPHQDYVRGRVFNKKSDHLMTFGGEGLIRVWDVEKGSLERVYKLGTPVGSAQWFSDEHYIMGAPVETGSIKIWDAITGHEVADLPHDDAPEVFYWSDSERYLLTRDANGTIRIWDVYRGKLLLSKEHLIPSKTVGWWPYVEWSKDESRILTAGQDGNVVVWNATNGETLLVLKHPSPVHQGIWSQDEQRILTYAEDGGVRIWDGKTGALIHTLSGTMQIRALRWLANDQHIMVLAGEDVIIWDTITGEEVMRLSHKNRVGEAYMNVDESRMLVSGYNSVAHTGELTLWDVEMGTKLMSLSFNADTGEGIMTSFSMWNKDTSIFLTYSDVGKVQLWDTRTGSLITSVTVSDAVIYKAVWTSDEQKLVVASGDGAVRIIPLNKQNTRIPQFSSDAAIRKIVFHERSGRVLIENQAGRLEFWDINSGKKSSSVLGSEIYINEYIWSNDGKYVMGIESPGSGNRVIIWNAETGEQIDDFENVYGTLVKDMWEIQPEVKFNLIQQLMQPGHPNLTLPHLDQYSPRQIVWRRDAKQFAAVGVDGLVYVFDVESGDVLFWLQHPDSERIKQVVWSPKEEHIATIGEYQTIRVWDAVTGTLQHTFVHQNVQELAWSPDGSRILARGKDNFVRLWDLINDNRVLAVQHKGNVYGFSWSPDSSTVVSWSWLPEGGESDIIMWDANTGHALFASKMLSHDSDVHWSADNSQVIIKNGESIKVRDVKTGTEKFRLALEQSDFSKILGWSGGGNTILAIVNNQIWAWSAIDGKELWHTPYSFLEPMWTAGFERLLIVTDSRTLIVFPSDDRRLVEMACQITPRNLSLQEWRSYFKDAPYHRSCTMVPIHPSYLKDLDARLQSGQTEPDAAISELATAMAQRDEDVVQYEFEAREVIGRLVSEIVPYSDYTK